MVHGVRLPLPPVVAKHPVVDTYPVAGASYVQVADDYRWLEDAKSPATHAFIASENAYTQKYFDPPKSLLQVRTRMDKLLRTDFVSTPQRRGNYFFFSKRGADENQASIYMRSGLHGADVKLQEASGSGRPALRHYSLRGGHSAGVSQTQLVKDYADEMAFLWAETK